VVSVSDRGHVIGQDRHRSNLTYHDIRYGHVDARGCSGGLR
jgi:hypothetical protein